jgi:AcrR family transcriptional regulator
MAKPKFDRDLIIEKSKDLFWQYGYNSSSMQDVVQATGLKPGSIYNSFGNKEALYKEALESYTNKNLKQMQQNLENASSIGLGICQFLDDLIRQSEDQNYSACFLIKTQFEITEEEGDLHNSAVSGLERVEEVLRGFLIQEYGEELGHIRATSVMLHMHGIRVYSYRKNAVPRMHLGVREGLPWLPWDDYFASLDTQA